MNDESEATTSPLALAVRRHPFRLALIAAAVVLLAILAVVLLTGGDDDEEPDDTVATETTEAGDASTSPTATSVTGRSTTTTTTPATGSSTSTSVAEGARTFDVANLPAATCEVDQALVSGSAGDGVECLQTQLNAAMTSGAELTVDGAFGPATDRAVREFQTALSLAVDGVAGPQTLEALGIDAEPSGSTTTSASAGATSSTSTTVG